MTRWSQTTAWVVLALLAAHAAAADDLRQRMGAEVYRAAGLHKLTAQERRVLQAWIDASDEAPGLPAAPAAAPESERSSVADGSAASKPAAPSVVASAAAGSERAGPLQRFGLRPERPVDEPEAIEAHILGEFTGWTGKTLFRLDNGQVWQQRKRGRYFKRLDSPAVRISRALIGYRMEILETGVSTGVKRIQ